MLLRFFSDDYQMIWIIFNILVQYVYLLSFKKSYVFFTQ